MIDTIIEESCVYCSKCLSGLNDFNRKMHIETCKVRKLVDNQHGNNSGQHQDSQLDAFLIIGDNCTYCFKSFKDFKSDFNKRLHLKCCKIKKETYDEKNAIKMNMGGEHCVFCTKPLANLNDFNKRMHIENCKIRKSIENNNGASPTQYNGSPSASTNGRKVKDENLVKLGLELGENCMYCSKSFINLSDFNKKLHFDYCKLKKKKMNQMSQSTNNSSLVVGLNLSQLGCSPQQQQQQNINVCSQQNQPNNSLNNALDNHISSLGHLSNQLMSSPQSVVMQDAQASSTPCSDPNKAFGKLDLGESCLFCSRSLVNLSNFNKRIHIETCKIKTLKKATNKLRQTASASAKAPRKRPAKKEKIDSSNTSINNLYSCQNLNKTLTLELMGSNLGNLVNLGNLEQHQLNNLQNQPNNNTVGMLNGHNIIHINQLPQLQQQQNSQQTQLSQQQNHNQSQQQQQHSQLNTINSLSQFDSLVASLNNSNTINLSQMQQQMNSLNNNQQLNNNNNNNNNGNVQLLTNVAQIKLDPNGPVYRQNSDGIFI